MFTIISVHKYTQMLALWRATNVKGLLKSLFLKLGIRVRESNTNPGFGRARIRIRSKHPDLDEQPDQQKKPKQDPMPIFKKIGIKRKIR